MTRLSNISQGSPVVVAKDILRSIALGDTGLAADLVELAGDHVITFPKVCLCEGLAEAAEATSAGLRSLARLIAVAEIAWGSAADLPEGGRGRAHLTADVLLSTLIGPAGDGAEAAVESMRDAGLDVTSRDVELVAALLAVEDGDELNTRALAGLLDSTSLLRVDAPLEARQQWDISSEFRQKLRAKAFREAAD